MLLQLHEGPIVEELTPEERQLMRDRLDDTNIQIARAMSPIMVLFVALLWSIDFMRAEAGILQGSPIYLTHAVAHTTYALGVVPALLLWAGSRFSKVLRRRLLWAHVVVMVGSVLVMGMASLLERKSLVLLGVAMMLANLMYHVPRRPRTAFNVLTLSLFTLTILTVDPRGALALLVLFGELLSLILVAAIVGGLHNRQRLVSMVAAYRYEQMAMIDVLTGVSSRRRLEDVLERDLDRARRGHPVSVILLDMDRFKSVNDRHGHEAGDDVLRSVARVLQQVTRLSDVIGRWGGEEFLVVCTDTDLEGATRLAERLAAALRESPVPVVGQATASFGVAQAVEGDTLRDFIDRADLALYRAKEAGRDRVVAAADTPRRTAHPPADVGSD
jgi:diguanylate cyclase (GGDEF)-like protein